VALQLQHCLHAGTTNIAALVTLYVFRFITYDYSPAQYCDGDKELASLAVRVQNLTLGAKNIYDVGPSSIAFALSRTGGLSFSPISAGSTLPLTISGLYPARSPIAT
jgi:hypothetical protein